MSLFRRETPATYQAVHGPDRTTLTGTPAQISRALADQQPEQPQPTEQATAEQSRRWWQ